MQRRGEWGWIEVICGSMFSGKTEELLRRIRRAEIAKQKFQVFNHSRDDQRYGKGTVGSHRGDRRKSTMLSSAWQALGLIEEDTTAVFFDEGHFFGLDLVDVCNSLADDGIRVVVAGLDTDFRGEGFGPMPELMAQVERVDKLQAICVVCGADASRTQRLINGQPADYDEPVILVGAAEEGYEARCRHCHQAPKGKKYEGRERRRKRRDRPKD